MTINEIEGSKPISPMTPEKARIEALKRTKDAAAKNLKAERDRQKLVKAQKQVAAITTSLR